MQLVQEFVKVENLKDALFSLAEWDNDFNGKNGEGYLWDVAKEEGYTSNVGYLFDAISKEYKNDVDNLIFDFFACWLGEDDYYLDYSYKTIKDDDGNILYIVMAFICGG